MNKAEQEQHFAQFVDVCQRTLLSKGDDYAGTDRLGNFKVVGAITGLKPEQACLVLIATKVARLGQLIGSGRDAKNESVKDSVLDLVNYGILLDAILSDK